MKQEDAQVPAADGAPVERGVRPHAENVASMLRELDDTTNQTWRGKRARWAALVREQAARLERARLEAMNAEGMAECMAMFRDDMIRAGVITEATPPMFMTEAILSALHKAGWRPNAGIEPARPD